MLDQRLRLMQCVGPLSLQKIIFQFAIKLLYVAVPLERGLFNKQYFAALCSFRIQLSFELPA